MSEIQLVIMKTLFSEVFLYSSCTLITQLGFKAPMDTFPSRKAL